MTAPGHRACVTQSTLARRHPLMDWMEGLGMSVYASKQITVPSHADWIQPLEGIVKKLIDQEGENLQSAELVQIQQIAIDRLLLLVESLNRRIEWSRKNNKGWIESRVEIAIYKNHKRSANAALTELGMALPLMHDDPMRLP